MTWDLALGTSDGLLFAGRSGDDWYVVRHSLSGQMVTSVAACEGTILAGTTDGVYRSDDAGQTWRDASAGLTVRHLRWLACSPGRYGIALAGTEPAAIFRWDGEGRWDPCPEVAQLRDAHGWYLPYSPEAGCVRGFAIHESRAYAAVEVGGVLRSDDRGGAWQLVKGSDGNPDIFRSLGTLIHPDVHSISVHPSSPDLVTAPTGGGLYRSVDGGATWTCLYPCYCRAAWVDPDDPAHLLFGPADGVSSNGRIEESHNGGHTWYPASEGLQVPWPRHMVERFVPFGDELLAVLSNGQLLGTPLATLGWRTLLPEVMNVRCAAVA